jgi:hypothetical protein
MEHVARKRGKAGRGRLGVAAAQAWLRRWRRPASAEGRRRDRGSLGPSGL